MVTRGAARRRTPRPAKLTHHFKQSVRGLARGLAAPKSPEEMMRAWLRDLGRAECPTEITELAIALHAAALDKLPRAVDTLIASFGIALKYLTPDAYIQLSDVASVIDIPTISLVDAERRVLHAIEWRVERIARRVAVAV